MSISRIEALVKELETIKLDCLGEDPATRKAKTRDDFFGLKEQITIGLDELAKNIQERRDIIEKYGRNRKAVQLNAENQKKLDIIKTQLENMKKLVNKEKAKGKGLFGTKLTDEEIKTREDTIENVEFLIKDIALLFYDGKITSSNNRAASAAKKDLDQQREERLAAARKAKASKKNGDKSPEEEGVEMQEMSVDDQAFMGQVQQRDQVLDAKLDQVLAGVRILRSLGEEIHDEIQLQGQMIKEIDTRVDKTTNQFKVANKKMKDLLEESGGATRWCPIIIFIVILVALVGYILTAQGVS